MVPHNLQALSVKAAKAKGKRSMEAKNDLLEFQSMWAIKEKDLYERKIVQEGTT